MCPGQGDWRRTRQLHRGPGSQCDGQTHRRATAPRKAAPRPRPARCREAARGGNTGSNHENKTFLNYRHRHRKQNTDFLSGNQSAGDFILLEISRESPKHRPFWFL